MFGRHAESFIGVVTGSAHGVENSSVFVAIHHEVRATVVLVDNCLQQRLGDTRTARRQRNQVEPCHEFRIVGHEGLVAADPRVVVGVTRLVETDDRMNQKIGARLPCGLDHHGLLGAVDGAVGLKRHHAPPPETGKLPPEFGRRQAKLAVVVVDRKLERLDPAGDSPFS